VKYWTFRASVIEARSEPFASVLRMKFPPSGATLRCRHDGAVRVFPLGADGLGGQARELKNQSLSIASINPVGEARASR
jgi:hypothetical protein